MPTNPPPGNRPPDQANALRNKFNLAPQPIAVNKIAGLVSGRSSASMEEISEIINTNSGVTQKLLTMAYPKQAARLGATVQMATSRLGVNRVIVVMVGDLLTKSVLETFETMVDMKLEVEATATSLADHGYLIGTVRFTGENNGQVALAFSPHMAMYLSAHLTGGEVGGDEHTSGMINDTIGELVNIVTGSLQSKLTDAGMNSAVSLPEVVYQTTLPKEGIAGGSSDFFFFRCGSHSVVAHLSIDPSAPKTAIKGPLRAPPTHGTNWRANGA